MNILIVKTSSIGDIIQAFPVLQYLKSRFPEASIDWVVEREYQELVEAHPLVRRAIPFGSRQWRKRPFSSWRSIWEFFQNLRQESYDLLFDLQGNIKSSFITANSRAREKVGLGWKSVPELPNFFTTRKHVDVDAGLQIQLKYLEIVKRYFKDEEAFHPKPFALKNDETIRVVSHHTRVMVACNSRWNNKTIPLERLKELLHHIDQEENPYFYFVCGNEVEKKAAEKLMIPGKSEVIANLSFPSWQALMREMDLVITVDSAALALCGTTETPSISFFGPSLADVYKPVGDHHSAWQGSCPYNKKFSERCPALRRCVTGACLKNIKTQDLVQLYRSKKVKSM